MIWAEYTPLLRGAFLRKLKIPVTIQPSTQNPNITLNLPATQEEIIKCLAELELPELPVIAQINIGNESRTVCIKTQTSVCAIPIPSDLAASDPALRAQVVAGRIALITGAAQGFGAEIATALAKAGAQVFIADLNIAGASKLAEKLQQDGYFAVALQVNVADENSVSTMFNAVAEQAGGLDLVISNAGVLHAGSVLNQELRDFKLCTDINYVGFFLVAKYAGQLLSRQRSTAGEWLTDIIEVNSKSGLQGSNRNGAYAGSKFGGIGLVQSFALELVELGIKVNAVCPGNFLDGPLWSDPKNGLFVQYLRSGKVPGATTIAQVREFYEAKVPMRRSAYGADVIRAIYYLVEQQYETGQALPVTGGQVMLS